jgi:hypothetical protein
MPTLLLATDDPTIEAAAVAAFGQWSVERAGQNGGTWALRHRRADVVVVEHRAGDDAVAPVLSLAAANAHASVIVVTTADAPCGDPAHGLAWVARDHAARSLVPAAAAVLAARLQGDDLRALTPTRLLRLAAVTAWTGALGLRHQGTTGVIVCRQGELMHATWGDISGTWALESIAALQDGTLCECDPPEGAPRSIAGSTHAALDRAEAAAAAAREAAAAAPAARPGDEVTSRVAAEADTEVTARIAADDDAFILFSDEELAAFALDDAFAAPAPRGARTDASAR